MTTPQQQLLTMRLAALKDDIQKVRGVVQEAAARDGLIHDLAAIVKTDSGGSDAISPKLRRISAACESLRLLLDEVPQVAQAIAAQDLEGDLVGSLQDIPGQMSEVRAGLKKASEHLREIERRMVKLDSSRLAALEESLGSRCAKVLDFVAELERKLDNEQNARPGVQKAMWDDYELLLELHVRPLFIEYVDFLGGLTVRDTALDDGVCEMTDTLLRRFLDLTKNALVVPARQAAISSAMNSVIKLGFPEWTAWAVPLVAHEVGLSVAADLNNEKVQSFLQEHAGAGRSPGEVRHLFADAFATLMMGPAYACAAILLRFQPHHELTESRVRAERLRELLSAISEEELLTSEKVRHRISALLCEVHDVEAARQWLYGGAAMALEREEPADVERAELCLGLLHDQDPVGDTTFGETAARLTSLWRGVVDDLEAPDNGGEQATVQGQEERAQWLHGFQADVLPLVQSQFGTRTFGVVRWSSTDRWLRPLLDSDVPIDAVGTSTTVVEMLNAAWRARLAEPSRAGAVIANLDRLWRTLRNPDEQAAG